jgi:hypothetical protein
MHDAIEEIEHRDWRYYRRVAEQALRDAYLNEGYNNVPQAESLARKINEQVHLAVEKIKETID